MFGGLAIGFAQLSKPSQVAQGLPREVRRKGVLSFWRRRRA
jgi:hypothetical protein